MAAFGNAQMGIEPIAIDLAIGPNGWICMSVNSVVTDAVVQSEACRRLSNGSNDSISSSTLRASRARPPAVTPGDVSARR
eukprot:364871-Chlamydomonas_euryale.AAC.9